MLKFSTVIPYWLIFSDKASLIYFVNDGSTRKIGAYFVSNSEHKTSFELSHGTQSQFLINRADGKTGALKFETDIDSFIQTGNNLTIYQNDSSSVIPVAKDIVLKLFNLWDIVTFFVDT